jgi:hypothetical protein
MVYDTSNTSKAFGNKGLHERIAYTLATGQLLSLLQLLK